MHLKLHLFGAVKCFWVKYCTYFTVFDCIKSWENIVYVKSLTDTVVLETYFVIVFLNDQPNP